MSEKLDPRVKRTRQLLQQALADLIHEKAFGDITVQDIAARAEVNRATFYAHFVDKYALLNYSVHEIFQEQLSKRLTGPAGITPENLRGLALITFEFMGNFMGRCKPGTTMSEKATMARQAQVSIYEIILEWLKTSPGSAEIPAETIATVLSSAIFGSALQWGSANRRESPEAMAGQVLALLEGGWQQQLSVPV